jgi:phosphomannomutase
LRGDIVGGIIGDAVAKKGDVIVYDLRCSHSIPRYFENKGIVAIPSRAGNYNIKKLMRKKKAVFGMEITGHYFFEKFSFCESPLYGLRILMEQADKTGKTLTELAKPFIKYNHSGVINFPAPRRTEKIIEKLKEKYRNGAQNSLDGLTIEFSNWWFNIRQSHTEPLIRMVVETSTPELLEQKKKELSIFFSDYAL